MQDYLEKGERALNVCGLGAKIQDYVWQLSGGQKHLLALAGMAALSPDILILDEPIAQLDPAHADKIYEVLKELNETYNKTIIVIEHHTEYIARFCRHVILLKDGTVKWKLDAEEAMRRVDELQESDIFPPQVTIAARRMEKEGILPKGTTLPVSIGEGRELLAGYLKKDQKAEMPLSWNRKDGETLAEFRNVTVKYRSVKGEPPKVFDQFNLKINKGEKIALIGSNGAGKSTMLKLMMEASP